MSFKAHLIIVSAIIVVVYLAWMLFQPPAQTVIAEKAALSPYSISIIHASWGLNCPVVNTATSVYDKAYVKKSANTQKSEIEDNVLRIISNICAGKDKCSINVSPAIFGNIPPLDCTDKLLQVEYRCFSFDRPWQAQASSGALNIDCNKIHAK